MNSLESIKEFLEGNLKQYTYSIKSDRFGKFISAKADTYRGASIYFEDNLIQVMPAVPTWKGRVLSGGELAKSTVKNYGVVAETTFNLLKENAGGNEVRYVTDPSGLKETEKAKRSDQIGGLVVGVILLGLSYFLYQQLTELEESGGSMRINWIVALMYETFGKNVTCIALALAGALILFISLRKLLSRAR